MMCNNSFQLDCIPCVIVPVRCPAAGLSPAVGQGIVAMASARLYFSTNHQASASAKKLHTGYQAPPSGRKRERMLLVPGADGNLSFLRA
ncbi:hypothetical protein ZHAS_00015389 [Anopheles sinensis]|uniref:Uncharacterized protein n=1 Tax=Anopheles sinensis TaxID=74873 RepID=A0A084WB49_ANOSI|nr:hypothetical protein ZHAS_00015389 [Anopheles sinensis]